MADFVNKMWLDFSTLLNDAVFENNYSCVEILLRHEPFLRSIESKLVAKQDVRPKDSRPLLLAIQNENYDMIKLFHRYNYTLSLPHAIDCHCLSCMDDKFGQRKRCIDTLRALSNPLWIAVTATDPFQDLFELHKLKYSLKSHHDCFQIEYDKMCEENEDVCKTLLNEIKSEQEGEILMNYKTHKDRNDVLTTDYGGLTRTRRDLSFIELAVDYKQKSSVAHSVVQHFLANYIFSDIPLWQKSNNAYRMFLVITLALLYPITSLLSIFYIKDACPRIMNVAMKPFVKFINGAASFITFLTLIGILGSTDRNGIRTGQAPTGLEIVVFIWIIGFVFAETIQLIKGGFKDYFNSGWNWVDFGMNSFMMFSAVTWIVLYFHKPISEEVYDTVMHVVDGAFTLGIILSFFRIMYLCQITSYLGLLQLCLGEMVMVILQFAFVALVVLLAFTVAMVFLCNASKSCTKLKLELAVKHRNDTFIYASLKERFNGFWSTLFTMVYSSLTMEDSTTMGDFADGSLIHLWSNVLFIVFFGISMIVFLNMLIAMMNHSYEKLARNLDKEHMYARTVLWMEYTSNGQGRPVPFNLIPSLENIKTFVIFTKRKIKTWRINVDSNERRINRAEAKTTTKYRKLCQILFERYLYKHYNIDVTKDKTSGVVEDLNDLLLVKIKNKLDHWGCPLEAAAPIFIEELDTQQNLPVEDEYLVIE